MAKKKTEKKKPVGVDAFGRRLGTQGALIDTKLSKTPKSPEQLAKECKLPLPRIMTHLRDLHSRKLIKKNKDGQYYL